MDTPPSIPVICPMVVGRARDLALLERHIDRTQDGQGQILLISGEAGIGKSRLVAEGKAYARM